MYKAGANIMAKSNSLATSCGACPFQQSLSLYIETKPFPASLKDTIEAAAVPIFWQRQCNQVPCVFRFNTIVRQLGLRNFYHCTALIQGRPTGVTLQIPHKQRPLVLLQSARPF